MIKSFAITPAAPAGMTFNTTTGALSGTPTSVAAATTFTITATGISGVTATKTFTFAVVNAASYTIGTTGPSGGKIFYVSTTGFPCGPTMADTCNYLEAAPNTWSGGTEDPKIPWSGNTTTAIGAGAQATGIGTGYKNTLAIVAQDATANRAATAARAYNGGGNSDWYLGSYDEMNLLYLAYVKDSTLGIKPGVETYWTSTEYDARYAWDLLFTLGRFGNGGLKANAGSSVRPIRAFGGPTPALATPLFTLSKTSETATVNTAATGFTVTSTGGAITSFAISPAAPAGMTFNTTTGALSGTPTATSAATTFTITGSNATGTYSQTFALTVIVAPTYTVGATGPGGGKIFYVSTTGFGCGPTTADICNYLEAAPNTWSGGTEDPKLPWSTITTSTVGPNAQNPGLGLGYQSTLAMVAKDPTPNMAGTAVRAYNGGGKSDWFLGSYDEMNLLYLANLADPTYGIKPGVETYWTSTEYDMRYSWDLLFTLGRFGNGGVKTNAGSSVRPIRAFGGATPTLATPNFTLSANSESVGAGAAATGFTVNSTGGAIASFSISPAAPAGMTFSTTTGAFSGTPTTVAAATVYYITGSNATGSFTRKFTLTVTLGTPVIALSAASETRTVNTAATGFTVTSTGGTVTSYSISPAAPAGMTFNTTTGAFSGTPTSIAAATVYTVTATNASGTATKTFTFAVVVAAPAFTLSSTSETRMVNTLATGFTVNSTGGAITSFSISPAAPAGMTFNTTTGAFSGTPTTAQLDTVYTITGTNASGSSSKTFTFTVPVALPAFTLSSSSETATATIAATGFTVNSTGGQIASFSISPAAPAGMTFNTTTGALSGTPTSAAAATTYTITGTNISGTASKTFVFTVKAYVAYNVGSTGPTGGIIFYASATGFPCGPTLSDTCNYLEAAPSNWFGAGADTKRVWSSITTASSGAFGPAKTLGSGYKNSLAIIAFDSTVGIAAQAARAYAPTVGGITYNDWYLPAIDELNLMYTKRYVIGGFIPDRYWSSSDNGPVYAWASGFDDAGALSLSTTYQEKNGMYIRPIRAFAGPVASLAAPAFTLSATSETVAQSVAAVGFTVVNTGGDVASYAISPAAPAGMTFDTTTGKFYGTPSTSAAATTFTITATNTAGSATRTFSFTVTAPATCAQGGICVVGDIGPGGGRVFYVNASGFACGTTLAATCKYLEAAPNTWNGGTSEPLLVWSNSRTAVGSNAMGSAIGTGAKNTYWINTNDTANIAAKAVAAYRGGGKSDWYLPSTDEMSALYTNRTNQNTVANLFQPYWTSTETTADLVVTVDFAASGYVGTTDKRYSMPTRAIRAF